MIEQPKSKDVGRKVIYRPGHGAPSEMGKIKVTCPLAGFAFVQYGTDSWAKLTRLENLEWADEKDDKRAQRDPV